MYLSVICPRMPILNNPAHIQGYTDNLYQAVLVRDLLKYDIFLPGLVVCNIPYAPPFQLTRL